MFETGISRLSDQGFLSVFRESLSSIINRFDVMNAFSLIDNDGMKISVARRRFRSEVMSEFDSITQLCFGWPLTFFAYLLPFKVNRHLLLV